MPHGYGVFPVAHIFTVLQGLPDLPALQGLPDLPGLLALLDLPGLPGLPGLLALPGLPGLPDLPDLQALPALPDLQATLRADSPPMAEDTIRVHSSSFLPRPMNIYRYH